ncbi:MAG: hemolysin family protein [bacterium]
MGGVELILLLVLLILIFLSGFYSGAETAVTSANRVSLHRMAEEGDGRARLAIELMKRMDTLLCTTLVGTNLANAAATTFAGVLIYRLWPVSENTETLLTTLIVTPIILVFGEMVPKAVCRSHATPISKSIAGWLKRSELLLLPAVILTRALAVWAARRVGEHGGTALVEHEVTRQDLHDVAELAREQGILSESSGTMFMTVFELHNRPLSEVMVPLGRMSCLPENATVRELEDLSVATGHTRFPVYSDNETNTVGIIDLREVLVAQHSNPNITGEFPVRAFIHRSLTHIMENRTTGEVIHELHYRKPPLAIVVDADGHTVGMVTAEDLIEQVVGDLRDERDQEKADADSPRSRSAD